MALTNAQLITELYVGYYNRAPDPTGFSFWLNALNNGTSLTAIADDFAKASETAAVYPFLGTGGSSSLGSFVTSVYENILNRAPDASGQAFWTAQLVSGAVSPGAFIVTLEASVNMQSGTADALTLANKTAVGLIYEQDISELSVPFTQTSADNVLSGVTSDLSTLAAAEAKVVAFVDPPVVTPPPVDTGPPPGSFTTGTDNFTATDNALVYTATIGGSSPTLTANDSLTGMGNTLVITDNSGSASQDMLPSGLSLSGVPTVTLTTTGNAGTDAGHPFDLSGFAGITSFALVSSASVGDFINTGSIASVSVTTHGASNPVTIADTGLSTLTLLGSMGAVSLNENGPTPLTIDANGLSLVGGITDASGQITSLTITGSGAASSLDALNFPALTNLSINGMVSLGSSGTPFSVSEINPPIISASSDNASINLQTQGMGGNSFNNISVGHAHLTFGNGDDTILLMGTGGTFVAEGATGGNAGFDTLVLGIGNNTVTINTTGGAGGYALFDGYSGSPNDGRAGIGGDGGHDSITLGNGNNNITDNSAGGHGGNGAELIGQSTGTNIPGAKGANGGNGGNNAISVGDGNNTITDNSVAGAGGQGGISDITNPNTGVTTIGPQGSNGLSGTAGNDIITVGTGNNTIDLGSHANDTVILGTDAAYNASALAANQTILNAVALDFISFKLDASVTLVQADTSGGTTTLQAALLAAQLGITEARTAGATGPLASPIVYTDSNGSNTFVVESHSGGSFGANDTVIVEIMGTHVLQVIAGYISLSS